MIIHFGSSIHQGLFTQFLCNLTPYFFSSSFSFILPLNLEEMIEYITDLNVFKLTNILPFIYLPLHIPTIYPCSSTDEIYSRKRQWTDGEVAELASQDSCYYKPAQVWDFKNFIDYFQEDIWNVFLDYS